MVKDANINVRTDKDLKEKADKIFNKLGISASEAINIFYSQVVINKGLPFDVTTKPVKQQQKTGKQKEEVKAPAYKNVVELRKDKIL